MRKRPLRNCRLYLVLDKGAAGKRDLAKIARAAISGGVDILQLRWKEKNTAAMLKVASRLKKITSSAGVLFIINDNPYLAKSLNADGVHIGKEDISIKKARSILGHSKIIGYSTHDIPTGKRAALEGADYISVGPIFKTPTKPDYKAVGLKLIRAVSDQIKIPIFAIGGINIRNIKKVTLYGAQRVAVVRALVNAKAPKKAAGLLKKRLDPSLKNGEVYPLGLK